MIDAKQVIRLLQYNDPDNVLLSVHLSVPAEVPGLREMSVRLDSMLGALDAPADHRARMALAAEVEAIRSAVTEHARDWLGHGVAIYNSAALGFHEEVAVATPLPDRVVLGRRPYVRLLLSALAHVKPYFVVVVDRRQAWLYRVEGHAIERLSRLVDEGVRDSSYGGWAGFEEYRVRNRAWELARKHYRSTAATLDSLLKDNDREFVVGGNEVNIVEFIDLLPHPLRERVAGTFVVDPHTMTAGDLRLLSGRALAERRARYEARLRADLSDWAASGLAVTDLQRCAEMVTQALVDLLIVIGDEEIPGWVCDSTGDILVDQPVCPTCGQRARRLEDVIDEMVARVVSLGGRVEFLSGPGRPGEDGRPIVGARLRHRLVRRES
ncbi:hypothetical protein [Thermasporomyces composti]|jgi:peptide chain release factor subunit 1|uniref:Peptide chain release factor subunit 1 n=1 Tax=Thermasporomyces composti TaxID=696763 RepID=A0A3D9V9Y9_THECX|nr:hypothetical protein [Thermasporomyces composti]REF38106.1 hypothetical protein DFJ64_3576 [Thermasporomyces composti]